MVYPKFCYQKAITPVLSTIILDKAVRVAWMYYSIYSGAFPDETRFLQSIPLSLKWDFAVRVHEQFTFSPRNCFDCLALLYVINKHECVCNYLNRILGFCLLQ